MAIASITNARPYAKAVFELALQQKNLLQWSNMLAAAAQVCLDKRVKPLFGDPLFPPRRLGDLVINVCARIFDNYAKNLIRLLAYNKRLSLLAEIKQLYEIYRADYERNIIVNVISFMSLSETQQTTLMAVLERRLQRRIVLKNSVDKALLGGAIIQAGDLVIDGSVRGQLQKLYQQLI